MYRCPVILILFWVLFATTVYSGSPSTGNGCPDLQAMDITLFGPQSVTAGEKIDSRVMIFLRNETDTPTGTFSIGFYLSTDALITVSDQLLTSGREFVSAFDAFGLDGLPGFDELAIPGGYPAGAVYLGIIVDEYGAVAECDENNNTVAIPINVSAGPSSVLDVPGAYSTITAAIAAAATGDTINIAAGEFNEALVVDKDLVFRGAGWDQTILKTNSAPVAIMVISGADLLIEDLQFWSWFGDYFVGKAIHAENSSLLVRNCKLVEINQFNIELYGGSLSVDNIEMTRSIGVADIGIRVFDATFCFRNSYGGSRIDHVFDVRDASLGLIENNIIDGSTVYWAQGVRMMNDGIGVIRNNLMIGQHDINTQRTHQPAGIALFDECYADISENEIHGFVYGLYFGNNSDAKAYRNTLTDNHYIGVVANLDWPGYDGSTPDLGDGAYLSPGLNIIRNNADYNVQNRSGSTVYAKGNDWGTYVTAEIDSTLFDNDEDPALGPVIFGTPVFLTVVGYWVAINPAPDFTIVFDEVVQAGFTRLDIGTSGPRLPELGPALPAAAPLYYDISTSAAHTGLIEIGIPYDEADLSGSEAAVRLYHYEGDQWADVTTQVNTETNQVFGKVNLLSPFILVESPACCLGRVGDANGLGGDEPTIGDISVMIDAKFITGTCDGILDCFTEADINQSGGPDATCDDITIGDISTLIDYLFITGPTLGLANCL